MAKTAPGPARDAIARGHPIHHRGQCRHVIQRVGAFVWRRFARLGRFPLQHVRWRSPPILPNCHHALQSPKAMPIARPLSHRPAPPVSESQPPDQQQQQQHQRRQQQQQPPSPAPQQPRLVGGGGGVDDDGQQIPAEPEPESQSQSQSQSGRGAAAHRHPAAQRFVVRARGRRAGRECDGGAAHRPAHLVRLLAHEQPAQLRGRGHDGQPELREPHGRPRQGPLQPSSRPPARRPVLDPHPRSDPRRPHAVLVPRLQQDLQPLQQHADAHVGARVAIQERAGVAAGHAADGNAAAAVLLLRARVPEQHRPPARQAAQGFPHAADALQAEAWAEAVHVPQMQQGLRRARRLADAREELRQAVVLHMRVGFQAQALAQGSHPRLRQWARAAWRRLVRGRGGERVGGRCGRGHVGRIAMTRVPWEPVNFFAIHIHFIRPRNKTCFVTSPLLSLYPLHTFKSGLLLSSNVPCKD